MLLAVRISSYGCTWEVWRALKKLELLSAAPRATLTRLSCSPNFPRASITRYTHAKHEPILKYFYSPLDGMLVHSRVTPSIKFASTHLYTRVERDTVRVKCLAQEHNLMSPARARNRTTRSRDELTPRLPQHEVGENII